MENTKLSLEEEAEMTSLLKRKMGYNTSADQCSNCNYSSPDPQSPSNYTCSFNQSISLAVEPNGKCNHWSSEKSLEISGQDVKVEQPIGGIPIIDLTKRIESQQLNS